MTTGRPRLAATVVRGDLTDGEVVVSVGTGEVALILNSVGDAVLDLCDGTRSILDIATFLGNAMPAPPDADIAKDVTAIIEQLVRAGIVVMAE